MDSSFDEFGASVRAQARRIGQGFTRPDDDWTTVLILEGPQGMEIVGVEPAFLDSHGSMDLLVLMLAQEIRRAEAQRLALVASTWTVEERPEDAELTRRLRKERRLGDHPRRREELLVEVADWQNFELWRAPIRRRATKRPALGPWARVEDAANVKGRLVAPLVRALRPQG
jgi:hypothetical protein